MLATYSICYVGYDWPTKEKHTLNILTSFDDILLAFNHFTITLKYIRFFEWVTHPYKCIMYMSLFQVIHEKRK